MKVQVISQEACDALCAHLREALGLSPGAWVQTTLNGVTFSPSPASSPYWPEGTEFLL